MEARVNLRDRVLTSKEYRDIIGQQGIIPVPDLAYGVLPEKDNVMHPPHYAQWKMEPIEFIAINDLPWWLANVIKYTMRFEKKDGLQDLHAPARCA
jgi:hypothetical protein